VDQRSSHEFEKNAHLVPLPHLNASLMRMSVPARLAIAGLLALLVCGAVYWALA
jgi:hypothetical protein